MTQVEEAARRHTPSTLEGVLLRVRLLKANWEVVPYELHDDLLDRALEHDNAEVLHGTTDLEIVKSIEVDPKERYYLYFDSGTKSKNLDYAIETYENGTLKRLTASIKDQVAPITSATVGGLVGIFHGAAVAPAVAYPPGKANCTQIAAAIRQNPDDPRLRLQQEDRWTPTENSKFYAVKVALDQLRELFKLANPHWSGWANASVTVSALRDSSTEDDSSIWGKPSQAAIKFPDVLCPDSKVDQHGKVDQQCPPSLVKGLVLRNAIRMTVSRSVCDAVCDQTPQHDQLTALNSFIEAFPQFGTHFLIPVHSGFAQDAAADVALSPDGLITYVKLQNTNALAGSIKEIGGQVSGLGAGASTPNASTAAANKSLADSGTKGGRQRRGHPDWSLPLNRHPSRFIVSSRRHSEGICARHH
jgi:hypothetical protein